MSANFPQESLLEPHWSLIGDLRRHQNRHLRRKLQGHLHRRLKIGSIGPKKKSFSRLDLKRRDVWWGEGCQLRDPKPHEFNVINLGSCMARFSRNIHAHPATKQQSGKYVFVFLFRVGFGVSGGLKSTWGNYTSRSRRVSSHNPVTKQPTKSTKFVFRNCSTSNWSSICFCLFLGAPVHVKNKRQSF